MARFALQGFESTSMNEIATDVGLKKPSVYGHFRNKDELYLSLLPLLIEAELAFAAQQIRGGTTVRKQLLAYLKGIRKRYEASYAVQFWTRALANPPGHIYDEVVQPLHGFMASLERIILDAVRDSELADNPGKVSSEHLAMTFMAMVDSLQSELVHGGTTKYNRRLKALWAVFEAATLPR